MQLFGFFPIDAINAFDRREITQNGRDFIYLAANAESDEGKPIGELAKDIEGLRAD